MKHTKSFYHFSIFFSSLLLILTSSYCSSYFYQCSIKHVTSPFILSSLDYSSTFIGQAVDADSTQLDYTISLLLEHPSMLTLDASTLPSLLAKFIFYSPQVSNAYVINRENEIIAGINNNTFLDIDYPAHIKQALDGSATSYVFPHQGTPLLEKAYPIYSSNECVGALIVTYEVFSLSKYFEILQARFPSMVFYLIDTEGKLLLSSDSILTQKFIPTIDITKICSTIDYAPTESIDFLNYSDCYGRYYTLAETNWTLLLIMPPTDPPPYTFLICLGIHLLLILLFLLFRHLYVSRNTKASSTNHYYKSNYWT